MNSLKKYLDKSMEFILVLLMGASVLNVLWQVITRFLLKNPSSFTEEIARYLLIWIGLLGASYGFGKNIHLAIDVLKLRIHDKKRLVVDVLIHVFVFLFAFIVMIIGGFRLVNLTLELHQISAALQIKIGYVYLAVPLSGVIMSLYSFMDIIGLIKTGWRAA
ncbi:MAG: TRAP transporter small permease [Candidatus Marinimicrobia bacterium]|nr:TRAP transporter small permease [Candidatus Neomarinimicrobiota bacterium]